MGYRSLALLLAVVLGMTVYYRYGDVTSSYMHSPKLLDRTPQLIKEMQPKNNVALRQNCKYSF